MSAGPAIPAEPSDPPPRLDMRQVKIEAKWALRIPANLAIRRQLIPFTESDGLVQVACANLDDIQGLQAVERYIGQQIEANLAEPDSLQTVIQRVFRDSLHSTATQNMATPGRIRIGEASDSEDGDDVIALGDEIFHAALIREATDIHIEPAEKFLRVRFRAEGQLEEYRQLPMNIHGALLSRLKVISGMDIAEKRAPQDGRFTLNTNQDLPIDVRTATIPTKHGERMTMRLLATRTHELTLERLGLLPAHLQVLHRNLQQPNGLILLTGPTGCGKSTTLYGAIRHLIADRMLNVITIEDPVEYLIDGISQVEVDLADKVSFHKALRSALRHDPDVLMIGEIRDQETAEIATKAALTGHLVFSTLHTNSAISSIYRLLEMGTRPFLLGSVSRMFIAQRLVRRLCERCRVESAFSEEQAMLLSRPELTGTRIFSAGGCKYCAHAGYAGRTGLFELIEFRRGLVDQICKDASESDTLGFLEGQGQPFLVDDAIEKMRMGLTSFEEAIQVVHVER